MLSYRFSSNEWQRVHARGKVHPVARAGHSAVIWQGKMYIFGGKDQDNEKLGDLWEFDFHSLLWQEILSLEPPCVRSGHSATVYQDFMLIFGGIFEVTQEKSDLFLFDFSNQKWVKFFNDNTQVAEHKAKDLSHIKGGVSPRFRQQQSFGGASPRFRQQQTINKNSPGLKNLSTFAGENSKTAPKTSKHQPSHSINFAMKNTMRDYTDNDHTLLNSPNRTAKSHLNSPTSSFRKKRTSLISKKIAEKKGQGGLESVNLNSPTSLQMKNRFIIKSSNPSFDTYYQNMRKRKTYQSQTSNVQSPSPKSSVIAGEEQPLKDPNYGFLKG